MPVAEPAEPEVVAGFAAVEINPETGPLVLKVDAARALQLEMTCE